MQAENSIYTDAVLLSSIASGDHVCFTVFFVRYKDKIYTTALRMMKSATEAEEIVQDVFLKIWTGRHLLAGVRDAEAYLFMTARNRIYDALKKAAQLKLQPAPTDDAIAEAADAESRLQQKQAAEILNAAIARLPAQQRVVYELIQLQGLTRAEAAEQLSLSLNTVKSHYDRATRSIREYYSRFLIFFVLFATVKIFFSH